LTASAKHSSCISVFLVLQNSHRWIPRF